MPLFSIITVNLNNAAGLKKTIESVVSQSFRDFEYIVIDGASTDGSRDVIKEYETKITYQVSEKDTGIYNAMNKALKQVKGKYCLFLNSGDFLTNSQVLKDVSDFGSDADIVYGNMMIHYPDGKKKLGKMPEKITFHQMITDTLWHPVSFIKKTLFDKYGYYREDIKIVADYEFFFKTIIVHKVTAQYMPVTIAGFSLDGMSSYRSNAALIASERKKIQLQYFPGSVIELEESKKVVKNNFYYRIRNLLKNKLQWFRL
jgi:glycosyltransferase involved in cell wall biosynthesis